MWRGCNGVSRTPKLFDEREGFVGGDEARAATGEFVEGALSFTCVERLDGVGDDSDPAAAVEQALCREAHAKFRNDSEDCEFLIWGKLRQHFFRVRIIEYIEGLLFEDNLLNFVEIRRD